LSENFDWSLSSGDCTDDDDQRSKQLRLEYGLSSENFFRVDQLGIEQIMTKTIIKSFTHEALTPLPLLSAATYLTMQEQLDASGGQSPKLFDVSDN
jgi:hypothetical protein